MPNLPISLLPVITGLTTDSEFVVSKSGTTYKVSFEEINNTVTGFTTGGTFSDGVITFTKDNGDTYQVSGITDTFITGGTFSNQNGELTLQNNTGGTITISGLTNNLSTTGITTDTNTDLTWDNEYYGIIPTAPINLYLPDTTNKEGYSLIIKDESGTANTNLITIKPAISSISNIDNTDTTYIDTEYGSITLIVRNSNWWII